MGGAKQYVYRDGQRLAPAVAYDLERMAAAFVADTGETLHVAVGGGLRWVSEQQEKRDAYLRFLSGGPWAPLAADPRDPKAYHVETNPNGARAVDLYDSGAVGGVGKGAGPRHQWMLANAHRFNFENEGLEFDRPEAWHKRWTGDNPWVVPTSLPEEDDMYTDEDRARDNQMAADVAFIKKQLGGSKTRKTTLRQDMDWVKASVGGSNADTPSVRAKLKQLDGKISELASDDKS